jgi:hypothetical protein
MKTSRAGIGWDPRMGKPGFRAGQALEAAFTVRPPRARRDPQQPRGHASPALEGLLGSVLLPERRLSQTYLALQRIGGQGQKAEVQSRSSLLCHLGALSGSKLLFSVSSQAMSRANGHLTRMRPLPDTQLHRQLRPGRWPVPRRCG